MIEARLPDDANLVRPARGFDQFRRGKVDEQQNRYFDPTLLKFPEQCMATASRRIRFGNKAAISVASGKPVFQKRTDIRIFQDLDSAGREKSRQTVGDRLIGIHHVDQKAFVRHEPPLESE